MALIAMPMLAFALTGCGKKEEVAPAPPSVVIASAPAASEAASSPAFEPSDPASSVAPEFPWPPPMPSSLKVIPRQLLDGAKALQTLEDMNQRLRAALERQGYGDLSYYSIADGFALVTRLERFVDSGKSDSKLRWQDAPPFDFTLDNILTAMFSSKPGRFRVIAFIVTTKPFVANGKPLTGDSAKKLVGEGANVLPPSIGEKPASRAVQCTALIYEFAKPPGGPPEFKAPGALDADGHLNGSGVLAALMVK